MANSQITVRLPDALVEFVDQAVAGGRGSSRAAVVAYALEREQRRQAAARDAEILAQHQDHEFDDLAKYSGRVSLNIE